MRIINEIPDSYGPWRTETQVAVAAVVDRQRVGPRMPPDEIVLSVNAGVEIAARVRDGAAGGLGELIGVAFTPNGIARHIDAWMSRQEQQGR